MDINEEEEIKKEFQLERVILFTDAVFAIILTIMVLDIKLPEGKHLFSDEQVREELIIKLVAYLLTFSLVARFWTVHLKLFRYLKDYNSGLLMFNLLFLFFVTLFPFAVSMVSDNISVKIPGFSWGWAIYILVVYATVFTQTLMTKYLLDNRQRLCTHASQLEAAYKWKVNRVNLYLLPAMMVLVIAFSCLHLSYYYIVLTTAGYGAIIGGLQKKHYPGHDPGRPMITQLLKHLKPGRVNKNPGEETDK